MLSNPGAADRRGGIGLRRLATACTVTAPAAVTLAPPPMKACTALPIVLVALTKATATATTAPVDPVAVAFCVEIVDTSTVFPVVVIAVAAVPLRGPMNASTSESIVAVALPAGTASQRDGNGQHRGRGVVGRPRRHPQRAADTLAPPPTHARVPMSVPVWGAIVAVAKKALTVIPPPVPPWASDVAVAVPVDRRSPRRRP